MNYLGIEYEIKNKPLLDESFVPFGAWMEAYLSKAEHPFSVAIERDRGAVSVFHSFLRDDAFTEANDRYVERLVKFLLWSIGGFRIYLRGCDRQAEKLKKAYSAGCARSFDSQFMEDVYERPLEIVIADETLFPKRRELNLPIGGHLDGCRIGFDAGGSDRKVSAVIDGKTVYSEEVVWHPKLSEDPQYQFDGIVDAFRTAAAHMPRVDAIGVSSAGVIIGNRPMVSSLFIKIPRSRRDEVKSIYERAAREIGDMPIVVANDGDVTALAGSMSLKSGYVMGLAMGTSEAAGYVSRDGNMSGWLNELAFAPVDLNEEAARDDWSGDIGVGCGYFSQDAVVRLAPKAGIELPSGLSPAEKLKLVQELAGQGEECAQDIFAAIGVYLAHTLALYSRFYAIRYLLVLGRVASGIGGDIIVSECNRVLSEEYPKLSGSIRVMLPDEQTRRIGQSVAAASLPETR